MFEDKEIPPRQKTLPRGFLHSSEAGDYSFLLTGTQIALR